MRRLLPLLLLTLAMPAASAPSAPAAAPLSPEAVARRFVAAVGELELSARPCALLSRRITDLLDNPGSVGLDPRFPGSYTAPVRRRACDVALLFRHTFTEERWRGTRLRDVRFVARRGDRVQLRADLERRFRRAPRIRRDTTDVFLRRERGAWRIVSPGLLWEARLDDGTPRDFAQLGRHLRWLDRIALRARRYERRLVRGWLRTRTPLAPGPLPFTGGALSTTRDRLGDAIGMGPSGTGTRPLAGVDLRAGVLRTEGERLTFELRFRGAVPREATIELSLLQGRLVPGTTRRPNVAETTWSLSLHRGWASAWQGEIEAPEPLRRLRASADGRTLRFAVEAAELRARYRDLDAVRVGEAFRWRVKVTRIETDPARLLSSVTDGMPQEMTRAGAFGTLHEP